VVAPEPSEQGGRFRSRWTCGRAGALSRTGRQGPELSNMWQYWSPSEQGDMVRSRGSRDNAGAQLNREAGSVIVHVAVCGYMAFSLSRLKAYTHRYPRS
jgi:hypothetical protein